MSKLSRPDLKQVLPLPLLTLTPPLSCFVLLVELLGFHMSRFSSSSNRAAIQGMGYRRLQTAGVPGFLRIRRGNAGSPRLFDDSVLLSVSTR